MSDGWLFDVDEMDDGDDPASSSVSADDDVPALETVEDAVEAIRSKVTELGEAARFVRPSGLRALSAFPGDDEPLPLSELCCILESCPDLLTDDELNQTVREFALLQLPDGYFPDVIQADGTPIYNTGDDPDTQIPNTSNPVFMVWLSWLAVLRSGNTELAEELAPKLAKGLEVLPTDERTQLICVPAAAENFGSTCPFAVNARKRGDLLSSSLMLVQAYQQLADIMQQVGRDGDSDMYRAEAQLIAKRVRMYFWDKTLGLFRASTQGCKEHDLWGSVLSVYLNVATSGQLVAISRYCSEHFDTVVRDGQVRALPADEFWGDCEVPPGEFENGGFWSGAAGWLAYTVDILNPELADRTIIDLAESFFRDGVFKMINAEGVGRFRDYLPSAAAPMPGITKMMERRRKREEQASMLDDF